MASGTRELQSMALQRSIGHAWNQLSDAQKDEVLPIDSLYMQLERVISAHGGEEAIQNSAPIAFSLLTRVFEVLIDETGTALHAEAETAGETDTTQDIAFKRIAPGLIAFLLDQIQILDTTISLLLADRS